MKTSRGFSIIEFLVAIGLTSILMVSVGAVILMQNKEYTSHFTRLFHQYDLGLTNQSLSQHFKNIVRLDPAESLLVVGDDSYRGLAGINKSIHGCDYTEDITGGKSIVRYTTLRKKTGSVQLLRSWKDTSADKSSSADELRLSHHDKDSAPFQVVGRDKELVLIDRDNLYVRRYKVLSWERVVTFADPYDDQPKSDIDGKPIQFKYTKVFLGKPSDVSENEVLSLGRWFPTHSSVFISDTYVLCAKGSRVVRIHDTEKTEETLFKANVNQFQISKFAVHYAAIKGLAPIEDSDFKPYESLSKGESNCINSLSIAINVESKAAGGHPLLFNITNHLSHHQSRLPTLCYSE